MDFENKKTFEKVGKPEGISFETPIGQTYEKVNINFPEKDLSLRKAFKEYPEIKEIINNARNFKEENTDTFNGVLLGNSKIELAEGNSLNLSAEKLHYTIYFAAHQLRQEQADTMKERYSALSTAGVVYDKANNSFYMSVRPKNSQEQPGLVDAAGGVLNPDFKNANPFDTIKDRFNKKLGLEVEDIKSLGIEKIFDKHYSLYNIAMYGEVNGSIPTVDESDFDIITMDEIEERLQSDTLTGPAKATLLLALAQDKFTEQGWGKERIKKIMES